MSFKVLKEIVSEKKLPGRFYKGILDTFQAAQNSKEVTLFGINDAVSEKDCFLIIGSLHKAYDLKMKAGRDTHVKVLILAGVLKSDAGTMFRVILFNECAFEVELAKLQKGDLLGFYEPTIVPNCSAAFTTEVNLFSHQIFFGRKKKDDLFFFFMRRNLQPVLEPPLIESCSSKQSVEPENPINAVCKKSPVEPEYHINRVFKKTLKRYSVISFVDVPDKHREDDSPSKCSSPHDRSKKMDDSENANETTSNLQSSSHSKPVQTDETLLPSATCSSSENRTEEKKSESASTENHNSESASKENIEEARKCTSEGVKNQTPANKTSHKNVDVNILKKIGLNNGVAKVPIQNVNYEYKKLKETHRFKEINSYGVVLDVLGPPREGPKKMNLIILVTDESIYPSDFKISIFYDKTTAPTVQKCQIVRFHRLKIEVCNGTTDGRVFNGWDVISFDPIEIDKSKGKIKGISSGKNCSFTEQDCERVFELKKWMVSTRLIETEERNQILDLTSVADEVPSELNVLEISREELEKYLYSIDQNVVTILGLAQLDYNCDYNFLCEVMSFHELDNDQAALIVGERKTCPLVLTAFPYPFNTQTTLKECLKDSIIKKNSLTVSILLENISTKPVVRQLESGQQIFVSHCKSPLELTKDKANLVMKCDMKKSDILLLNFYWKSIFKRLIKAKLKKNESKMNKESSLNPIKENGSPVSKKPKKDNKAICLNVNKCSLKDSNCIEGSSETAVISDDLTRGPTNKKAVDKVDNNVKNESAKEKSSIKRDTEELASSQLSTCVTELMKMNNINNKNGFMPVSVPPITALNTKDIHTAFACITDVVNNRKNVKKRTNDVNSLDEILSPSKRSCFITSSNDVSSIPNGSSLLHSPGATNRATNLVSSFSIEDFENHQKLVQNSIILTPRSDVDVDSESSMSSDDTGISLACLPKNHVSTKAKVSTNLFETFTLGESSKSCDKKANPTQKEPLSQTKSPIIHSSCRNSDSCDELAPSPCQRKANPMESSKRTVEQKSNGFVKTCFKECLTQNEHSTPTKFCNQEGDVDKGPSTSTSAKKNEDFNELTSKSNPMESSKKTIEQKSNGFVKTNSKESLTSRKATAQKISPKSIDRNKNKKPADRDKEGTDLNLDASNYSNERSSLMRSCGPESGIDDDAETVINLNIHKIPPTSTPTRQNEVFNEPTMAWVNHSEFYVPDSDLDAAEAPTGNLTEKDNGGKKFFQEFLLLEIMPKSENGFFPIVSGFCSSQCKRYQIIKSFPVTKDGYVCKLCQENGVNAPLSLKFLMRFHLVNYKTLEHVKALLTTPTAERLLGCSVESFAENESIRTKILSRLKTFLFHNATFGEDGVAKSQKMSLVLDPMQLNGKVQLHITDFKDPKAVAS